MLTPMSSIVSALPYIQIALSVILVTLILLQRSDADAGSAFGSDGMGGTKYVRRGMEKVLFNLTILVGVLFVASTLLALVV